MKQLFLVAAMAMGAAGCADDIRPIQIRDARALDATCEASEFSLYAGSLDLASLDNGASLEEVRFVMQFTVASQLEEEETVGSNNNFIVEEIEYTFESQPARTFQPERRPAFLVIPVGSEENLMNVSLIPPKALETVQALVNDTGQSVTLLASFRLKGKLASGVETESDQVTFPITVYNSGRKCAAPAVLDYSGSCGAPSGTNAPIACKAPTTQTP